MKNYADLLESLKEKGIIMHAEKNLTQIFKIINENDNYQISQF